MRTFVMVVFWFEVINFIVTMAALGLLQFPRVSMWSRGEYALKGTLSALLIGALGWMLWA